MNTNTNYSKEIREYELKIMDISRATDDDIRLMRKKIRRHIGKILIVSDYDKLRVLKIVKKTYNAIWQRGYFFEEALEYALSVAV